jgi:hypothetical protein
MAVCVEIHRGDFEAISRSGRMMPPVFHAVAEKPGARLSIPVSRCPGLRPQALAHTQGQRQNYAAGKGKEDGRGGSPSAVASSAVLAFPSPLRSVCW